MKNFRNAAVVLMALVVLVTFTSCGTMFGDENKWTKVEDPGNELVGKWVAELVSVETSITAPAAGKVKESEVITLDYSKKGKLATVEFADIEAYTFDQPLSDSQIASAKAMEGSVTANGVTVSTTGDVSNDNKSVTVTYSESQEMAVEKFVREMKENTGATVEINGKKNAFRFIVGDDEANAIVFKKSK